jgi:positive regulator of sigma E activity
MAAVAIRDVQERPVRVGCFGRAICVAHEACGNEILSKLHQQSRKAYIIR